MNLYARCLTVKTKDKGQEVSFSEPVRGSERAFSIHKYAKIRNLFHVLWGRSSLVLIPGMT